MVTDTCQHIRISMKILGVSLALQAGILTTTPQHPGTNHIKFAS